MARYDNGYSRVVAVVKVILPLVALGILSTLFLLSRPTPTGEPLPYTDVQVRDMAAEQRLNAPVYSGLSQGGATMMITADTAVPDKELEGVVHGEDLVAKVVQPSGYAFDIVSAEGTLNDRTRQANLRGGVRVVTSDGHVITMPEALMRSDLTYLASDGPVFIEGPLGTLEAAAMTLRGDPSRGSDGVALFHGGVKVIYDAQRESSDE